jgi:hypothetical protein
MNKPRVLLDSGAYTASRKGKPIEREVYAEFLKNNSTDFTNCVNLDVIGDGEKSYDNWKWFRGQGMDLIPVYHAATDEKWLRKYLAHTDYIALGAIANLATKQRRDAFHNLWIKYFLDEKGFPKVRIHGLGLTTIPLMFRYPWYSVDSFTPVISAVWGSVLLPLIRDNEFRYLDISIYRISDQGNHRVGTTSSFPNLPTLLKDRYMELIEANSFKLGKIYNQVIRPRRGKKDEIDLKPEPMFSMIEEPTDPEERTLANHWEERMRWNLTMWTKLQERTPVYPRKFDDPFPKEEPIIPGKKTIMYMGVSTTTHLEIFDKVTPKLDILISFAYLNDPISKLIKKYIR